MYVDLNTQIPYYFNSRTEAVQWEPPVELLDKFGNRTSPVPLKTVAQSKPGGCISRVQSNSTYSSGADDEVTKECDTTTLLEDGLDDSWAADWDQLEFERLHLPMNSLIDGKEHTTKELVTNDADKIREASHATAQEEATAYLRQLASEASQEEAAAVVIQAAARASKVRRQVQSKASLSKKEQRQVHCEEKEVAGADAMLSLG
jgi:hypothetical protein